MHSKLSTTRSMSSSRSCDDTPSGIERTRPHVIGWFNERGLVGPARGFDPRLREISLNAVATRFVLPSLANERHWAGCVRRRIAG